VPIPSRRLGKDLLKSLEDPSPKVDTAFVPARCHISPFSVVPPKCALFPLRNHSFFSNEKSKPSKKASKV
jgi:hypothetical protein